MATKKQQRARLEEKRRIDAAESRRTGLLAQEKDRMRREAEAKAARAEAARRAAEAEENKRLAEPGTATPKVMSRV